MKYETYTATLNHISIDKYGEFLKEIIDKEARIIHTQFLWHNKSTTKGGAVIIYQKETQEENTKGLEQLFGKQTSIEHITYNHEHNTDDKECEKETTYTPRPETMLKLEKPENILVG